MSALFYFEWRKIWYKNKMGIVLAILSFATAMSFYLNYQSSLNQEPISSEIAELNNYPVKQHALKDYLSYWQDESEFKYGDKVIGERHRSVPQFVGDLNIKEITILLEENIDPSWPLSPLLPENFEQEFTKEELSVYYDGRIRHYEQGWLAIYGFIKHYGNYLLFGIVILLFGGSMNWDIANKRHQRFMKIQGISTMRLFGMKLLASMIAVFLLLVVALAVLISISSFIGIGGDLNYPILTYYFPSKISPLGYYFIPLWRYLIRSFVLLIFSCLFLLIFCFTIGRFVRNQGLVWLSGFLLLGLAELLPAYQWNPLLYLKNHWIASGIVQWHLNTSGASVQQGILLLTASIIILIGVNYLVKGEKNEN